VYTTISKRIQEKMLYQEFELLHRDLGEFAIDVPKKRAEKIS
jgi:hypothetical protein